MPCKNANMFNGMHLNKENDQNIVGFSRPESRA